jgi:hypothetical protein
VTFGAKIYGSDGINPQERRETLRVNGPRLNVIIRSIAKPESGKGLVPGSEFSIHEALIDTGASDICIAPRTAKLLGLQAVNMTNVGVVGASIPATVYAGFLEVPELHFSRVMEMYAPNGAAPSSLVLLGRSFLNHFIMNYNGPDGTFTFYGPPEQIIHETPDD